MVVLPDVVVPDTDEPESEITCGELDALSLKVTAAVIDPIVTGAN